MGNVIESSAVKDGVKVSTPGSLKEKKFIQAVYNGDFEGVKTNFTASLDLNKKFQLGQTGLFYASLKGYTNIVRFLLWKKADAMIAANTGSLPLHIACWKGHVDIVLALLKYTTDIDRMNGKKSTPLSMAATNGNVEVSRILIEHGADVINHRNPSGLTLLHVVCNLGYLEVAKLLVEHGALLNVMGNEKVSFPIHLASYKGFYDVVSFLINKGSELYSDEEIQSPLSLAVYNNQLQVVDLLLNAGANVHRVDKKYKQQAIHKAAAHSSAEILKSLIAYKADVNAVDISNRTPLHLASAFSNYACAKLLIRHGANLAATTDKGSVPLALALNDQMKDILKGKDVVIADDMITPTAPPMDGTKCCFPTTNDCESIPTNSTSTIKELEQKVKVKKDELNGLKQKCTGIEYEIASLNEQIVELRENPPNASVTNTRHLECPICFDIPLPPIKIFQCEQGHIFCEVCKEQGLKECAECRTPLDNKCIRNRRLEDLIKEMYD